MSYPIMKCATFCLVAFCAFQSVYMWGAEDVETLSSKVLYKMLVIYNRVWSTTTEEFDATLTKGIYIDHQNCLDIDEVAPFFRKFYSLYDQCALCFNDAFRSTDPEVAQRCCRREMAELKELEKPTVASIKACLAKLAHDAEASRANEASSSAAEVPRNEHQSGHAN